MNTRFAPVLATLLLLLAMACQQSDVELDQPVEEQIAAALAAVPTITPQPTATPPTGPVVNIGATIESLEATIDSLTGRLATAESELLAQDEEFQDLIALLDEREIVGVLPDPQEIVTTAIKSTDYLGHCWVHRSIAGGNGDTFLIEWDILGDTKALSLTHHLPALSKSRLEHHYLYHAAQGRRYR